MNRSLQQRLTILWVAIGIASVTIFLLLYTLFQERSEVRLSRSREMTALACTAIVKEYDGSGAATPGSDMANRGAAMEATVQRALGHFPGTEGGLWTGQEGFIAYAYPTYEGTGLKRDVPAAELPRLTNLVQQVVFSQTASGFVQQGQRGAIIFQACPVSGRDTVAWAMTRIEHAGDEIYTRLLCGLAFLLAFVLFAGLWLARLFSTWRRELTNIERTLSSHSLGQLPTFPRSEDHELDRISHALNDFNSRLRKEYAASEDLSQKLMQAERMAALGRLASGLAHEIRNPLAAVRLKTENALADPPGNERAAMRFTLGQVARLERLLSGLLSLTQALKLAPASVRINDWLRERVASVQPQADAAEVTVAFDLGKLPESWTFDPDHLARAVENILLNAIQHSPRGGTVDLGVAADSVTLRIFVEDHGVGIDASVREQIFEPFVTGREEGVGLGLTLARAVAVAHGGALYNVPLEQGARFELEIPWRES